MTFVASVAVLLTNRAAAQVERYDLGQKLRAFERAWDQQPDRAARRRALPPMKTVVPLFFAGRASEAAQILDQTRFLLRSAEPPAAAERWAAALVVRPSARLFDPAAGPLGLEVRAYYDANVTTPAKATMHWALVPVGGRADAPTRQTAIAALPAYGSHPVADLPEGDYTLRAEVAVDGAALAAHAQTVSCVPRLRERLRALALASAREGPATTERLTLAALVELLSALAAGRVAETDYPAAQLVTEAEALVQVIRTGERRYGPERAGQIWLTLPTPDGAASARLFVPEKLRADAPVPIVVALHGAGGSENLFFDGYGNGAVVRLARQRGWMVVATRATGFGRAPPVAGVLDELTRRYPIDAKRVYLVGHSMGASHAVEVLQSVPERIAAVAALGGGGTLRNSEAVRDKPVFIACGSEDFALGWATALRQALEKAEAKVTWKEYPDVEHVAIVQDALADVFAFFEKK